MECQQEYKTDTISHKTQDNHNSQHTIQLQAINTPQKQLKLTHFPCPPKSMRQKNRRYMKLKQLWKNGYFQQEQIMLKYPLLYHQYVGKYKKSQINTNFNIMSQFLQAQLISTQYRQIVKEQLNKKQLEQQKNSDKMDEQNKQQNPYIQDLLQIKQQDLQIQEQSLIDYIEQQFLLGNLPDFNYEQIDNDQNLDDIKILEEDEEQKYFNTVNDIDSGGNDPQNNTGVQDF